MELTFLRYKQRISYAKGKSHAISKLDGTFKIPSREGEAAARGEGTAPVPFVALPSAPVEGASTTTAAGAAAVAAGQKRQREEESGEFTFLASGISTKPRLTWVEIDEEEAMDVEDDDD